MARRTALRMGMNGMERCRPAFSLMLVLLASVLLVGCPTPVRIEPVRIQEVSSYQFTAKREGLAVAVDPYAEVSRQKMHFGTDLLSRGVLPVLVVFRNDDGPGGFVLLPDQCVVMCRSTEARINQGDPIELEKKRKELRSEEVGFGLTMMVFPFTGLFTLPEIESTREEYADAVEIAENMDKVALTPRPVYRGDSDSGFLFFRLENADAVHGVTAACIVAENIRTNQRVLFILPFRQQ